MEKVAFKNKQGETLVGILEGSGDKGVILCHGFTGNKSSPVLHTLAHGLKDAFLCLRFDFSGNGESEGKFEDSNYSKETSDLLCAIQFMKKIGCKKVAFIGHSMGGSICLLAASKVSVYTIVTIGTHSGPSPERLSYLAKKWVKKDLPESFLADVRQTNVLDAAAKIQCPVLVVHGSKDDIVDVLHANEIFESLESRKKKLILDGECHDFQGKQSKLVKFVREFLEK